MPRIRTRTSIITCNRFETKIKIDPVFLLPPSSRKYKTITYVCNRLRPTWVLVWISNRFQLPLQFSKNMCLLLYYNPSNEEQSYSWKKNYQIVFKWTSICSYQYTEVWNRLFYKEAKPVMLLKYWITFPESAVWAAYEN